MKNIISSGQRQALPTITLGICAMDKKALSKPMTEILGRLPDDIFNVKIFGDECILNEPVEDWPVVECLIAFYSSGYPLEKALEYVELRKPFLINDLEMQRTLQDRRLVYEVLQACDIPVPRHILVNRCGGIDNNILDEFDDYVVINGITLKKPFLEKPVDADDHNIYIYYPMSAGGGSKRLFRKVKDRSSEFYPDVHEVRREGSYIYEEFLNTQGTDVKVYTVGANYGHAEARKSPVVDGRVHRSDDGLEVRYPVILSPTEKEITQKITAAFKQTVCGFDFLRAPGKKSYVCDVNGWSFVKNSRKYYDDCSRVLCETMLLTLRPEYHATLSTVQPLTRNPSPAVRPDSPGRVGEARQGQSPATSSDEELLCVISVIRHGDRTPKQKMKLRVSDQRYLDFFHEHVATAQDNVKIKSKKSLVRFLELTKDIIDSGEEATDDKELFGSLLRIRDVLERHKISGINRKIQMKPEKWRDTVVTHCDGMQQVVSQATSILIILKWGGDLTPLGEQQATDLGTSFRTSMYPESSAGGVLRLHSTFRHDLKIKASDEGRVMKTAAAFTKGLLELEGGLTPVIASLVTVQEKDNQMLDHYDNMDIKQEVSRCKNYLNRVLQMDVQFTEDMLYDIAPISSSFMREALLKLGNPRNTLARMHAVIDQLCEEIRKLSAKGTDTENPAPALYLGETYALMLDRWDKLNRDFYKVKVDGYDLTKVPEVYDMCRYDILHNYHVGLTVLEDLFRVSELFADCVVPQEYGIDEVEKRTIGVKMCHALLRKIQYDLNVAKSGTQMDMQFLLDLSHGDDLRIRTLGRCVRTRLYFTSESHLYTLLNVLMFPPRNTNSILSPEGQRVIDNTKELSYLSQISFRLFDNRSKCDGDPTKYRCEILFSAGACADPTLQQSMYLAPMVSLNRNISCDDLIQSLNLAIAESSRSSASTDGLPVTPTGDLRGHIPPQIHARSDGDTKSRF